MSEENHDFLQEARNAFMRFAETIALSVDDAAWMFRNSLGYHGPNLSDPLGMSEKTIKQPEMNIERIGWSTDWDTRKCSQVLFNKPRFMVRKIIG